MSTRQRLCLMICVVGLILSGVSTAEDAIYDDFEDGVIDTTLWVIGGSRGGVGGPGSGGGQWFNQEVIAEDGYLQARATTPTSGGTNGSQAWTTTVYNFNDGRNWIINFKWEADIETVGQWAQDYHLIEITDGQTTGWPDGKYFPPDVAVLPGTEQLYLENGVEVSPQRWSIYINHTTSTATLYERANRTGTVHSVKTLDSAIPWYVRFITVVVTAAGFPAKDCRINLYSFSAAPEPAGALTGRIAFVSSDPGAGLFIMNADGSSRYKVPLPYEQLPIVGSPQWSPDGEWLTFHGATGHNGQIYIVRPEGTGFRRVTDGSGNLVEPSFSPDGLQIVFCGPDGRALYIINTDGTDLRRLPVDGSFPKWSPLGDKILYSNWGRTYESDLFLYDLGTSTSTKITTHLTGQAFVLATWSPDGTKLAVTVRTAGNGDVWIMNSDGSGPRNLTADWSTSYEGWPSWSPDGQYIVFTSDISGNSDIWYMRTDGTNRINITNSPEDELVPAVGVREPVRTYHVDGATGDNTNDGLTRQTAFATIQRGINVAEDYETVLVWPGVYNEEIGFWGDAITVKSAADAAVVETDYGYAFSFFSAEGSDTVLSNFIIRNSQYGIYLVNGSSPTLRNLTIVNNDFGISAFNGSDPDISNCIVWDNNYGDLFRDPVPLEAKYSCIEEGGEGEGNISIEPLFADANGGDYHLLSERGRHWPAHDVWVLDDVSSSCVDGGDPTVDPSVERMPNGGRINMGAYGNTAYASMSEWQIKGDINHDGVVNFRDFAIVAENWLEKAAWVEPIYEPPYNWLEYNGHHYALTLEYGTWEQAEEEAVAAGGHLVTINDADENDWLPEFIKDSYCRSHSEPGANLAWIGLQKLDGEFEWISGEPVTYTNFYYHWLSDGRDWYIIGNNHWDVPGCGQWDSNPLHNTDYDYNPRGIIEIPW